MVHEDVPISGGGEFARLVAPPLSRSMLYSRRASLLGPWNWLDQLRFRFDLAIELLDPDLSYVLSPLPEVGRAPDIRSALLDQRDELRLSATSVLRLAKARSFTAGGLRIRIFPLLVGQTLPRQPVGLLLVGDAATDAQSGEAEGQIDRRLDAAGQWLTAAVEGMVGTMGGREEGLPSPNRLDALIDVVDAFHQIEDPRQLIELTVEAIALWYDADVRAYRQDASGSFVLETWLPGIDLSRVPRRLSGSGMWERDEVFRLESVPELESAGWDVRSAETFFVPIAIGDAVRWLVTVSAGSDSGIKDMLEFFRRFDGLLLSNLEREAEDALRRHVADRLCLDEAPFEATLKLGLEASAFGVQASAARLEVFYAGTRAAALTSTWGSFALDADDVSAQELTTARDLTLRTAIGANVMAVFTFQKEIGAFSSGDVLLARAAMTVFANWLSGTFRRYTDERNADVSIPRDFVERLRRDVDRARRENRGGALAVMRPRAMVPHGVDLDVVAQVLEDHVRDSDTVGVISDAAAALLPALPAEMTSAVTERLLRAAAEQAIDARVSVVSLATSSESPEALVHRALSNPRGAPDVS